MILISIIMAGFLSGQPTNELPTVGDVDIHRYEGLWYEIARLPNSFEKGLECVTARYTVKDNGRIRVLNRGFSTKKGTFKSAKGRAWVPDDNFPGRLKVSFFWPFAGNYYIIDLDEAYNFALVGDPSRKYLWILSRTAELNESIYEKLLDTARTHGFETGKLLRIEHNCK